MWWAKKRNFKLSKNEIDEYKIKHTDEFEQKLNDLVIKMQSKFCPILGANCLGINCIHFYKGKISFINGNEFFEIAATFTIKPPNCKLWRT